MRNIDLTGPNLLIEIYGSFPHKGEQANDIDLVIDMSIYDEDFQIQLGGLFEKVLNRPLSDDEIREMAPEVYENVLKFLGHVGKENKKKLDVFFEKRPGEQAGAATYDPSSDTWTFTKRFTEQDHFHAARSISYQELMGKNSS